MAYFELCLDKAQEDSVFILDDIHWSREMEQAWREIKARQEVSVSFDLYRSGIVLFKKGISKQDYVLEF